MQWKNVVKMENNMLRQDDWAPHKPNLNNNIYQTTRDWYQSIARVSSTQKVSCCDAPPSDPCDTLIEFEAPSETTAANSEFVLDDAVWTWDKTTGADSNIRPTTAGNDSNGFKTLAAGPIGDSSSQSLSTQICNGVTWVAWHDAKMNEYNLSHNDY